MFGSWAMGTSMHCGPFVSPVVGHEKMQKSDVNLVCMKSFCLHSSTEEIWAIAPVSTLKLLHYNCRDSPGRASIPLTGALFRLSDV